ncbi:threonine--tRNA ligase [Candidatus Daviesbacteria bacterium RIFCSPLOWO2_01_FULL_43_38]|uniref:Threonine--tRNA ligase n=3 Tax=Candidatus Daviesiibacteriota TaxID=1752718 RepID=A0A1F5K490_9BACT|nr:MAG: Threonine-tRNA ligase [Candidatus Daviesbacteria bacterium GW2011_GWA1_42_6]KKS71070.1 MAG: Threonine-tRNA ligase [Candidatus Daviesbacteria bacterium GW2011_GWA2_42_7]OGE19977.1 MAG: threonine--tRNA ligase [Candidatus Daviesbacteria bacterium RIFCSPHIGHO2_01_FULL_43_17]OGE35727.1 MAG: threonine--tRNA ligase [Candidatus Daviesbacteria bacterium RIFCSPHIGHO2_12_FULL_43_11]OGE63415.1 MAG: threonine--tRNA ligase [Candidatus Daviesbacteria bacterium RIFCSPLOWO2_01_FULL_43_38]OGE69641.1 MAG
MSKVSQEYLNNLRHSCAHLLAAAVVKLYPSAKPTIGPVIENGFYYDFEFSKPISEEDLPKIEAEMAKLVQKWGSIEGKEISLYEAKEKFAKNPYKLELIEELAQKDEPIMIYRSGDFEDLCRGGHIEKPFQEIKAFKLLSIAGAYWRGDEKNKMLTRIYGTCFPTQEELDEYLKQLEEAKNRDHRKIGKDLGLFVFSDLVGKGLPLFTAKGATIRRELERFVVDEEIKRGYQHVVTPPLAKTELYKVSGHYPYYANTMYPPMRIDEEELILRPMTCPHHFMLYKSQPQSYKDLPLKLAELSPQFRYEKSGELSGLTRVRMFCLADAHIFCTVEQAKATILEVLNLIDYANKVLGFVKGQDYRYRLSLGDRKDDKKYYKDDKAWETAENTLREVLTEAKAPFFEAPNEAAFYGPKIDIQIKNVSGKEETAFTVQYDFVMPKRFNLTYTDKDGKEQEVVVIHRSSIGAIERTMAFLIEKYKGAFPVWLSPVQVQIIPIAERHNKYGQNVLDQLLTANIRVELDERAETMQAKIRDAQMQKIPYMLIVGDREEKEKTVAVRTREGGNLRAIKIKEFIDKVKEDIESRS